MSPTLSCHRPAVPDAVRPLRSAARSFAEQAGASEDVVDHVHLAVSEAVTNVVLHAYPGPDAPGPVTLEGCVEGDELRVEVSDAGAGMEPRVDSPGAGVGLSVIAQLAHALRIERCRDGPGTRVRMRFAL